MDINTNSTPGTKEKFHFYAPGFFENYATYIILADFIEHMPQWFYDDFKISAIYGCFPNCIWNGGRTTYGAINRPMMEKIVEEFNKRDIAIRYTFTNPLLEEKHMVDFYGNVLLDVANNGKNEVLVNAPAMEAYVRKNYPDYKIISSTTKCIRTIEGVAEELKKDYYLVVLDSALNRDPKAFELEERGRLELLVDHGCRLNCPNREAHYRASGIAQLTYDTPKFITCPYVGHPDFADIMTRENFISREDITNVYYPGGFRHFKLDGRSFPPEKFIDSLMYYMVLPEYREKIKAIIKKEVYHDQNVW